MTNNQILTKLKDDEQYYGEFGKTYLSNSDIGALLYDLHSFKKSKFTLPMLKGRYLHTACLESAKLSTYPISDSSSRNTKIYKEEMLNHTDEMILLQKEVDELTAMVKALKSNLEISDMIWGLPGENEVPGIAEIEGNMWKAKADRILDKSIVDIKTTSDLDGFRYSARKYNYDSQAYIYQTIFGKPLQFIVIEKKTCRMGFFECSTEFIEAGAEKVRMATANYEAFYGENKTQDIEQYYVSGIL